MFIQTEATPNPATLKFIPGKVVLADGTRDYREADQAEDSPLAQRLFMIQGVAGVFFGSGENETARFLFEPAGSVRHTDRGHE